MTGQKDLRIANDSAPNRAALVLWLPLIVMAALAALFVDRKSVV